MDRCGFALMCPISLVVIAREKHQHCMLMTCRMGLKMALNWKTELAKQLLPLVIRRWVCAIC